MGENRDGEGEQARVLREHLPVVGRVVMALLGDAAEVERVLEHVAREHRQTRAPEGTKPLIALLSIARAACANRLSKLPLRTSRGLGGDAAPTTERMGGSANDAASARAALARLKPTEREAVVLHIVGGLDAADVAAVCNVDLGTAKNRISRGVVELLGNKEMGGAQ